MSMTDALGSGIAAFGEVVCLLTYTVVGVGEGCNGMHMWKVWGITLLASG